MLPNSSKAFRCAARKSGESTRYPSLYFPSSRFHFIQFLTGMSATYLVVFPQI